MRVFGCMRACVRVLMRVRVSGHDKDRGQRGGGIRARWAPLHQGIDKRLEVLQHGDGVLGCVPGAKSLIKPNRGVGKRGPEVR